MCSGEMTMKTWRIVVFATLSALAAAVLGGLIVWYFVDLQPPSETLHSRNQPNVIILFADDTGYADFQTYGHPSQEWTGVDRMASEGMKFTSWYSPVSVCTPSRAALLTGRYPVRSGIFSLSNILVFIPVSSGGLPKREVTIAEALRDAGYATGMVGKWHLGINHYNATDGYHLPMHHGFDYVGTNLPFSQSWQCNPKKYTVKDMKGCFVYENDKISEQPTNLQTLTSRLVRDTKDFITKNKDGPFFFYLSFPQTHAALFSSPKFAGSSRRGPYGDSVNEMGWAVNEVLNHLNELEIEKETFVVFLSDQGPGKDGCGEGGSTGPFRGGKITTWEGGVRVPAVAWWPGTISPNTVSHTVLSTMDLYPTILELVGLKNYTAEKNILIDGKTIQGILRRETEESPHEVLFFYCSNMITAVRYKRYKIHYYTINISVEGIVEEGRPICVYPNMVNQLRSVTCESLSARQDPPLIFDVEADPEEHIKLNSSTTEHLQLLEIVGDLVHSHQATILPVQSEIDKPYLQEVFPCCNTPACTCNYQEEAFYD